MFFLEPAQSFETCSRSIYYIAIGRDALSLAVSKMC